MSEEVQKSTVEKPGKRPNVPLIIVLAVIIVAVIAGAICFHSGKKALDARTDEAIKVDTVAASAENLPGNYSIRIQSGDDISLSSGYIEDNGFGQYVLHVLSEYEPREFVLEIDENGTLYNELLGKGSVSYKKSTDATVIKFEKEGCICTLTK